MERKTYTCERVIPDRLEVVYRIEEYYYLLKSILKDLEAHTFLPYLPKADRDLLYNDMMALGRLVRDFGYFVEDVAAFEKEEEEIERSQKQQAKEPDKEKE